MVWFPIGPQFVHVPRIENFNRISRRNNWGAQGRINHIAFEAAAKGIEPEYVYGCVTDASGQCAVFRKHRTEKLWTPVSDELRIINSNLDPRCTAVNPNNPATLFLGTWHDQGIYISTNRGEPGSWGPKIPIGGRVRKIIVDPRSIANVANTVLYAATDTGIYRSGDNGASWGSAILSGDVWSFAFRVNAMGAVHFYAGVFGSGVWYADTEPLSPSDWTNLNTLGIGLPAYVPASGSTPANFNTILVDCCSANPACAYAWFTAAVNASSEQPSVTVALYKTTDPRNAWSVASAPPTGMHMGTSYALNPYQGFMNYTFAVATNSPGNGTSDILFFGELGNTRSIDSGSTWHAVRQFFHNDIHTYAFYPENPMPGIVPAFYDGCDGGLGVDVRLADPAFAAGVDPADEENNAGVDQFPNSGVFINLNEGLQNSLVYVIAGDPGGRTQPYLGCVDTGLAVREGGMGWRGFPAGDTFELAVATGNDGVKVWERFHGGSRQLMRVGTDNGEHQLNDGVTAGLLSEMESYISPLSNFVLVAGGKCLTGANVEETITTTTADVAPGSDVIIPVVSTAGITEGTYLAIGIPPNRQAATAVNITPTSFVTATIYQMKPAGSVIRPIRIAVVKVNQDGGTRRISQYFAAKVIVVAANPNAVPNIYACATHGPLLFRVDGALTDMEPPPTWEEITNGQPSGITIASIVISNNGDMYVLLVEAVSATDAAGSFDTPLFKIAAASNTWEAQRCSALPTALLYDGSPQPFGKIVVDPVIPNRFYASHGSQVYSISLDSAASPPAWFFAVVGTGLPGCWITDLWIGNLAPASSPANKVILRAGVIGRGMWETDVTAGATTPVNDLYMRRHLLDHGWLGNLADGIPNPYDPSKKLWHYRCADIKIDIPQAGPMRSRFFQTDPEASGLNFSLMDTPAGPITNCQFDQLKDYAQQIPESSRVHVHVQIQNRSYTALNGVRVWVLFVRASAGVPALNSTTMPGVTFPFWDQFLADGSIAPALHPQSKWKSIGSPLILNGIDVNHPKVASWNWDVPTIAAGDVGHYCMIALIHAPGALIGESASMSVDEITLRNKQLGQKNLHIVQV